MWLSHERPTFLDSNYKDFYDYFSIDFSIRDLGFFRQSPALDVFDDVTISYFSTAKPDPVHVDWELAKL